MSAVVLKAVRKHTASVIFLHGLGDSGNGWIDACEIWQQKLPHVKFICPNAPAQPVTINGGMRMPSWHDIASLDKMDPRDFRGLDDSKALVEGFIRKEMEAGIPSERIVLGGFSQGSGLSVYTGYQQPHRLAGVVCLSGYLPYRGDFAEKIHPSNSKTPAFLCHGTADEVVRPALGENCYERLKEAGVPVKWNVYRGMAHSATMQELADIQAFLAEVLPAEVKAPEAPAAAQEAAEE